jgi:hypothetical protein
MEVLNNLDAREITFAVLFLALFIYILKESKVRSEKETAREEKYLLEAAKREEKYQEIIGSLTDKIEKITSEFTTKLELITAELRQIKEIVCDGENNK